MSSRAESLNTSVANLVWFLGRTDSALDTKRVTHAQRRSSLRFAEGVAADRGRPGRRLR